MNTEGKLREEEAEEAEEGEEEAEQHLEPDTDLEEQTGEFEEEECTTAAFVRWKLTATGSAMCTQTLGSVSSSVESSHSQPSSPCS